MSDCEVFGVVFAVVLALALGYHVGSCGGRIDGQRDWVKTACQQKGYESAFHKLGKGWQCQTPLAREVR